MGRLPFVFLLMFTPAHAAPPALWEMGLGVGAVSFPDYRGSDQQKTFVLPVPYFIYRGEHFSVDRRGIRGRVFSAQGMTINLSADVGVPASSKDGDARQGMPDLNLALHIGPSLEFSLSETATAAVKLKLPAQYVIPLDLSSARGAGWFFFPHVNYIHSAAWSFGAAFGPLFGTRSYHEYYYGVSPQYANPERPNYQADAGYSGTRLSMTLSRRFDHQWFGAFIRYEYLGGAAYRDSPLMRRNHSVVAGIGVSWIFLHSSLPAPRRPTLESEGAE